jgi:cob(I)alamin adenosyltransferase
MKVRWYTSAGDDGYTGVLGRDRVPKYADRTEACGTVDEASACLGLARAQAKSPGAGGRLLIVQRDLYHLMADLATLPEAVTAPVWLNERRSDWLESTIDELSEQVEMPPAFIVAGDSVGGATLDIARTVVRRAERQVARLLHNGEPRSAIPLKYLNRLSSLLFLMARMEDQAAGVTRFTLAADDA